MPQNLLYLTHRVPYPLDKGDRIRNWNVLKFLARRANVYLACLADEPVTSETRGVISERCMQVAIVPLDRRRWLRMLGGTLAGRSLSEGAFSSPELRQILQNWTKQTRFDAAIVSASSLAPYLREIPGVPGVIDLVDVDSQKWFDYAAASPYPKSLIYRLEGNRLRKQEADLPTWCSAVLLVSDAEREIYSQFAKSGPILTVTNGVDFDYFQPQDVPQEAACTFVGALDYKPNVDGACWFAKTVWPDLSRRRPHLRFRLVGRRPAPEVQLLANISGVEIVGEVADVRPWVARSAVVIVPLQIARGVQNKLLEALAMGKAVVSSLPALKGLKAVPGEQLQTADSPAEWTQSIERCLDDADLRNQLGAAGRDYVQRNHCWEKCLEPLAEILRLDSPT